MVEKKLVTVMGATGAQGGSVVKALLQDGTFKVRAISRNPDSEKSQALAKQGVEVKKAHANNKHELVDAFKGSYAVFAVTNFWDPEILMSDHAIEEKQGKLIADAAEEAKVAHLIWSSLPNADKLSGGKFDKVVHFDGKARVQDYIQKKNLPATFVHAAYYFTNLQSFMPPQKNAEGVFEFVWPLKPESPIAMIDIPNDFGPVVLGILKAGPEATRYENVAVSGDEVSGKKVAEVFSKITGNKAIYKQVDRDAYKKGIEPFMGPVVAEEFTQMLEYFDHFGFFHGMTFTPAKKYNPNLTDFTSWLKHSGWKGPQ